MGEGVGWVPTVGSGMTQEVNRAKDGERKARTPSHSDPTGPILKGQAFAGIEWRGHGGTCQDGAVAVF